MITFSLESQPLCMHMSLTIALNLFLPTGAASYHGTFSEDGGNFFGLQYMCTSLNANSGSLTEVVVKEIYQTFGTVF